MFRFCVQYQTVASALVPANQTSTFKQTNENTYNNEPDHNPFKVCRVGIILVISQHIQHFCQYLVPVVQYHHTLIKLDVSRDALVQNLKFIRHAPEELGRILNSANSFLSVLAIGAGLSQTACRHRRICMGLVQV